MIECEEVCYSCVRKEVIGSYGEVKLSLVDIRDGWVVASSDLLREQEDGCEDWVSLHQEDTSQLMLSDIAKLSLS